MIVANAAPETFRAYYAVPESVIVLGPLAKTQP